MSFERRLPGFRIMVGVEFESFPSLEASHDGVGLLHGGMTEPRLALAKGKALKTEEGAEAFLEALGISESETGTKSARQKTMDLALDRPARLLSALPSGGGPRRPRRGPRDHRGHGGRENNRRDQGGFRERRRGADQRSSRCAPGVGSRRRGAPGPSMKGAPPRT